MESFSDNEHIPLQDLFAPGRCTVLELSDIEQHEQQVIVGTLLRRVNKARMMTVREGVDGGENFLDYPVFALLEEAHRFAPAGASVVSTNILKQILSEGPKIRSGNRFDNTAPGQTRSRCPLAMYDANHHAHRKSNRPTNHCTIR